jgi:hypothetical protein
MIEWCEKCNLLLMSDRERRTELDRLDHSDGARFRRRSELARDGGGNRECAADNHLQEADAL